MKLNVGNSDQLPCVACKEVFREIYVFENHYENKWGMCYGCLNKLFNEIVEYFPIFLKEMEAEMNNE